MEERDFHTSEAAPVLITVSGEEQLVVFGGGSINGLNPATGAILWSHPHDPGNDLNINTPLWGGSDDILLVSSAYKTGSRALRLKREGGATESEELWFSNRVRFMFLSMVRLGNYVYGTSGDLGPSFLTAIDIRTGEMAWQHRGISRASIVYADGKAILLEEDGDLTLAKLAPEGVTVLSQQAKLFDTMSWTAPTLVGTTLYARDREKIVARGSGHKRRQRGRHGADGPGGHAVNGGVHRYRTTTSLYPGRHLELDTASSRVGPAAPPVGLVKVGAPETIHVTSRERHGHRRGPNNESQSRAYKAGRKTSTPLVPSGTITMTSRWEGRTLISEGTLDVVVRRSR